MTVKILEEVIDDMQRLEPSWKPPEKGTISFVNSGPGTQNAHARQSDTSALFPPSDTVRSTGTLDLWNLIGSQLLDYIACL